MTTVYSWTPVMWNIPWLLLFGCACGGSGSGDRLPQDVVVSTEANSDSRREADSSPDGWSIGCPVIGVTSGAECRCILDFDDAVLLEVGNSPVYWTEWPSGKSPFSYLAKIRWTVTLDGWEQPEVLVLEVPRVSTSDPLARRMVRLPASDAKALVHLELLDAEGTVVAEGAWSHELAGGRGWDLTWAWDVGGSPAQEGVQGVYNWARFEPRQPLCVDGIDECLQLWIGWYVRDPVGDKCIDASQLRVEAVDGQSIGDALLAVEQALACCDALQPSLGVDSFGAPAEWVTVHVPEPAMYLGTEFRLYCEWEAGAALRLPDHVSICFY